MNWKNILSRAAWTLIQAPIGIEVMELLNDSIDVSLGNGLLVGLVAAVLSALKSMAAEKVPSK